jgi:murein DD-endopeptidase MepM/ murein hydrolase activator NlpD
VRRAYTIAIAALLGALGGLAVGLIAPDRLKLTWRHLRPESPHQRYARALQTGGLAHTVLGSQWLAAAARAIEAPVPVAMPFTEAALVDPLRPVALGYAVTLKRGQTLDAGVTVETETPGRVFLDLFRAEAEAERDPDRPAASAPDDQDTLSYEVPESGAYILRVQPELLRGGHLKVTGVTTPSLVFPVPGSRGIRSVFGDPRDAGLRLHEGVDIFAKAGTQVLAAAGGVATVGENLLGGRVIWVIDVRRGLRYYYAHLQDQLVSTGTIVRPGDLLGTVGNTGNARTTPPHLHFGIYAPGEGAIDPDGFIRPVRGSPEDPVLNVETLGAWARTRTRATLRASPSTDAPVITALPRGAFIRIEGAVGPWARTRTNTHPEAFVAARELTVEASRHKERTTGGAGERGPSRED